MLWTSLSIVDYDNAFINKSMSQFFCRPRVKNNFSEICFVQFCLIYSSFNGNIHASLSL